MARINVYRLSDVEGGERRVAVEGFDGSFSRSALFYDEG